MVGCMHILFSHRTAIGFWRWRSRLQADLRLPAARPKELTGAIAPPSDIRVACQGFQEPQHPIDVLVSRASDKRKAADISYHVRSAPLPVGSVVRLDEGTYVASPELAFLQQATELDAVGLVQLGFELCGTYALAPDGFDMRGFCAREPLTKQAQIGRFLAALADERGLRRARAACGHVLDGSASPRETVSAMLLCLPSRLGGYGLPQPELNCRIDLNDAQRKGLGRHHLVVDMFWRKARVALEYDSDGWHASKERLAYDSRRRNLLKSLGLETITVTNEELKSLADLDRIAANLARLLGVRRRPRKEGCQAIRCQLHTRLMKVGYEMRS